MAQSKKGSAALRWSIDGWARETGSHPRTIQHALERARIIPGRDGKYSTLDMFTAVSPSPKERAAREAKLQQQIDEAETVRNERQVQEGQLGYISEMRDWAADIFVRLVQMVKQSKLSKEDQKRWIDELAATKFEPTKSASEDPHGRTGLP